MSVDDGGARTTRYWDWPFGGGRAAGGPTDDLAEELHALLVDAVRLQLRADVPVGAYLSGGLDSSIVTAHRAELHRQAPLRTLLADVRGRGVRRERLPAATGRPSAAPSIRRSWRAAATSGAPFRARSGTRSPRWCARPPTPMMLLADSVRAAGYKVVLTGEGADEAFGGYDLFKEAKIRRWVARCPESRWRARLLGRLYPYLAHSPGGRQRDDAALLQQRPRSSRCALTSRTRCASPRRAGRCTCFSDEWRTRLMAWDPAAALAAQAAGRVRTLACRWSAISTSRRTR